MNLTQKLKDWAEVDIKDTFYAEFEQSRFNWSLSGVEKEPLEEEIRQCFSRCTAIALNMELPVGAFIRALMEREDVPLEARNGLFKNILDEEKHQRAFSLIADAYKPDECDLVKANNFRKALVSGSSHPLAKARDLETILFIPLQICMRVYGTQSLERLINWISIDEDRHIKYNWEVSAEINIGLDTSLSQDILSIAAWVFEPLKEAKYNQAFWLKTAKDMANDGYSSDLQSLCDYGIAKAPFEIQNSNY